MKVETLNCPMCGAATSTDALRCLYCESLLATISCPVCFGVMFFGSKHCPRCGAAADRHEGVNKSAWKCPRCQVEMQSVVIGQESVLECGTCFGLWLDVPSFEKICADREQQAAVLGTASHAPAANAGTGSRVNYIPCPECSQLMNRINFAQCSGVILDLCKQHGIWFDRDELSRIVEFIHSGGLEASRSKEKAELEEQRKKLREEQLNADIQNSAASPFGHSESTRITGIASASGLLKFLLR
jgi:Zn-finger nucleic acid-binding protein